MDTDPVPADVLAEGNRLLAQQLTEALTAAIESDAQAADAQVKEMKSAPVKRLRRDASGAVADHLDAIADEAEAAQAIARAERKEVRRLQRRLMEDLSGGG